MYAFGPTRDTDDKNSHIVVAADPPDASSPPPRRMRLIVSSTSSEESNRSDDAAKTGLRHRGEQAYLVREIRGERVIRGRIQYHVFWDNYDSSEATWEPAANVNKQWLFGVRREDENKR